MKLACAVVLALLPAVRAARADGAPEEPQGDAALDDASADKPTEADAAPAEEDSAAAEDDASWPPPPADDGRYETRIVGRRSASRDRTESAVEVEGSALRDSARPSTLEALSQRAGDVYVPARGALHGVASGATGGIRIRGLGGSPNAQVLVVEDGVPDYQGIFGHPIPDAYVPFLLEDALVIKGGDSVLYGTNAMGGVVVLRSRWREEEGCEWQNDAAAGSYDTLRETLTALGRFGAWDFAGALHGLSTDGHRDGAGGDTLVATTAARHRFAPDLRLALRNKVVHLAGADPGDASHPFADHWYDVWRDNASLRLDWEPRAVRITAAPYVNVGVHRLYDGFRSLDVVAGGTAEATFQWNDAVEGLLGLGGEYVGGDVENRVTGERPAIDDLVELSFYDQLAVRPFDGLAIVAGSRQVLNSEYGFVPLYKAGARWEFLDGLSVRTRVARNFRRPTLRELYLPFPTANPDLRPEFSLNWDFGIAYEADHFEVSCSGFRTEADDLIKYFGSWPSAEVVNIDHIVIWGVEGSLGLRDLGPLSLSVAGGWQDVGRYTRQNPSAKLDFTLEAAHAFGPHRISGGVSGQWVHGLYMADYARQPIDDAFVMDLAVRYRYAPESGPSLEPYVFFRNFLDRRYAYVEGYPMPGFHVLAGLRVGF